MFYVIGESFDSFVEQGCKLRLEVSQQAGVSGTTGFTNYSIIFVQPHVFALGFLSAIRLR